MKPAMEKVFAGGVAVLVAGLLVLGVAGLDRPVHAAAAAPAVEVPAPSGIADLRQPGVHRARVVFAGGCFWGVQGVFQHVDGVSRAVSGYAGGSKEDAVYETVGSGRTGHAESVEITYDPAKVTYGRLLQVYFSVAHNPTQLNYQGPDYGTQYRSTIFAANAEQEKIAAAYIRQLDSAKLFEGPIVTTIETGKAFYPAEDYHQDFLTLNPTYPYIVYNDLPKIDALKELFPDLYREKPVLVMAQGRS